MKHKTSRIKTLGAIAALATGAIFAGPALAITIAPNDCSQEFMFTGSIVSCTIETTGQYSLTAFGAEGGADGRRGFGGGLGAKASGDFNLSMGDTLRILVGGMGGDSSLAGGGGGGGSFVVDRNNLPLVVSGGGGGGSEIQTGMPGRADNNGNQNGGAGSNSAGGGGGGGGFGGNGGNGSFGGYGGSSFDNGGGGGNGRGGAGIVGGDGGFGDGGGGGMNGGGGGGGFSGGDGGSFDNGGAGGGSFVADFASNPQLLAGINGGNGFITFELIPAGPADVPEPSSVLLFALALLGLGVAVRRRRMQR